MIKARKTRKIRIGSIDMGGDAPIVVQTMTATKTGDVEATARSVNELVDSGAAIVRVAVDNIGDVEALAKIRQRTHGNISVDLQENIRLAERVAPYVDKIRYNPGKLNSVDPETPWQKKVDYLVEIAQRYDCALRVGVNCGSLDATLLNDPDVRKKIEERVADKCIGAETPVSVLSAIEHTDYLESVNFQRFCVSIKDSNPFTTLLVNRLFSSLRPEVPLHLGVTEAGIPPRGVLKTRVALEPLLAEGIGDAIRVSLTVPAKDKSKEIEAGKTILANVANGVVANPDLLNANALDVVSCPSCSRVQNERFVELAQQIVKATEFAKDYPFKIAVMGCRVNGPGETDDADIGLWCGGNRVNLKSGARDLGSFGYDEIIEKTLELLNQKIQIYSAAQKVSPLSDGDYVV